MANITSPANFFHAMRRQLHRPFRKPMVIMSPKSLLRHPLCTSPVEDMGPGTRFQETFDDPEFAAKKTAKVRRVIFCSGKVYYDLLQEKIDQQHKDVAICRIEQLYPYPAEQIQSLVSKYKGAEVVWVQEEPLNMGAWGYLLLQTDCTMFRPIGRKAAASPATGHYKIHDRQQRELVEQAFARS